MNAMPPDSHCVTRRDQIERVCAFLAQTGGAQLPLFRAAADGVIGLIMVDHPKAAWPGDLIARVTRPAIVLISDDVPGRMSTAPEGWACARRLRYWQPNAVIAHGARGEAEHYRAAVAAALVVGRVAFIETSSGLAPRWAAFMDCPNPALVFVPRDGLPHPVAGAETRH